MGTRVSGSTYIPDEAQVRKWLAKSVSDYQVLGYTLSEILEGPSHEDVGFRIEELLKWARKLETRQAGGEAKEMGKRAVVGAQNLKVQVEKDWSGHLQQQKLVLLEEELKSSCADDNKLDWGERLAVYEKAEAHGLTRRDIDTILDKKLPDWQREVGKVPIEVETPGHFVGRTAQEWVQQNPTQSDVWSDLRRDKLVKAIIHKGIDPKDARRLVDESLQGLGVRVDAGRVPDHPPIVTEDSENKNRTAGRRAVLEMGGGPPAAGTPVSGLAYVPDEAQVKQWLANSASDYKLLGYSRAEILKGPSHEDVRLRIEELLKWARKMESRQAGGEAKDTGKKAVIRAQNLKAQVEKDWSGHLQQQKLVLVEEDLKNSCTDDNKLDWGEHFSVYTKAGEHGITRQDVDTILYKKLPDWQREVGAPIEVETKEQFVGRMAEECVRQNQAGSNVLSDLRREELVKAIAQNGIDTKDARRLVDECLQGMGVRVEAGVWQGHLPVGNRQPRSLREFHAALVSVDTTAAMDMFKRRAYAAMLRLVGEDEKVVQAAEAAEEAVSRDGMLAVWRFCWATGYRSLFIGQSEAKSVDDVVRLCDGIPDKLQDHLTSRRLEVWLEEALGYEGRSTLARAAGGAQGSEAALQCRRWLWLAGENRLSVPGGAGTVSSVPELVAWSLQVPGRVEELGKLIESSWLAGWLEGLASRDSSLSGLASAAESSSSETSLEIAGWTFIWNTGHTSLHIWMGDRRVEVSKLEDLEPLLIQPPSEVVKSVRNGVLQAWLTNVAEAEELANVMNLQPALKSDPGLASEFAGWLLFSLPLRGKDTTWGDQSALVGQFERDVGPLVEAWESKRLPWWLRCRASDWTVGDIRPSLDAAEREKLPSVGLHRVMWKLGARTMWSGQRPARQAQDLFAAPDAEIRELMESDLLPAWLETVCGLPQEATRARASYKGEASPLNVRAVRWAIGARGLAEGFEHVVDAASLIKTADERGSDPLLPFLTDGTLRAWLQAACGHSDAAQILAEQELAGQPNRVLASWLEIVLQKLGAIPPNVKIQPSELVLGRVPEGQTKKFQITVSNDGPRGAVYADMTSTDAHLTVSESDRVQLTCPAPGRRLTLDGEIEVPIGGLTGAPELVLRTDDGRSWTVAVTMRGGFPFGRVVGRALGWGAAGAAAFAISRVVLEALFSPSQMLLGFVTTVVVGGASAVAWQVRKARKAGEG